MVPRVSVVGLTALGLFAVGLAASAPESVRAEHTTAHFIIESDVGDEEMLARVGRAAESVYAANLRLLGRLNLTPRAIDRRLRLVVTRDYRMFQFAVRRRDLPQETAGFHDTTASVAVVLEPLAHPALVDLPARIAAQPNERQAAARAELERQRWGLLAPVAAHEAAHLVQHAAGPFDANAAPRWLVEGFAQLLEHAARELDGGAAATDIDWGVSAARWREFAKRFPTSAQAPDLRGLLEADAVETIEGDALCGVLAAYLLDQRPTVLERWLAADRGDQAAFDFDGELRRRDPDWPVAFHAWALRQSRAVESESHAGS